MQRILPSSLIELTDEIADVCGKPHVLNVYGGNGTGKTTVLKQLARRLSKVCAKNPNYVSPSGLEQFRFRLPETNIASLAFASGKNWRLALDSIIKRLSQACDDPQKLIVQPLQSLSTGQTKLIALATAIEFRHQTLLIDEPYCHVHSSLISVISHWITEGAVDATIVCATHSKIEQANYFWQANHGAEKEKSIEMFLDLVVKMGLNQERNEMEFRLIGSTMQSPTTIQCKSVPMMRAAWRRCLNMNLAFTQGEVVYVNGVNGSGKSTLLRTLGGLRTPKIGNIYLNDSPLYSRYWPTSGVKRFGKFRTSHLLQSLVGNHKTSDQSIAIVASNKAVSKAFSDVIGHNQWQDAYTNLSSGELSLLKLVAILLHPPNILFLDEPFTGFSNNWVRTATGMLPNFSSRSNCGVVLVQHLQNTSTLVDSIRRVDL